jgi:hypothetical protein
MQKNKFRIPPQYLVLDTIGSVLVGLGIYGLILTEEPPTLVFLHLQRDAWEFIVSGLILILPMAVYAIRQARVRRDLK